LVEKLRIFYPEIVFYSGAERHKIFEERHYDLVIESLPGLSKPKFRKGGRTTISAALSKPGRKSRSVYESTGIGKGKPGAAAAAEEIRLQRETAIYNELLYGPQAVVPSPKLRLITATSGNGKR